MCCFVVPAAEAAIVTIANIVLEHHEKKLQLEGATYKSKLPALRSNLKSLSKLLWGGSLLLAFEHLWHGEIQPFYPFITAATDPESLSQMYQEISTVGVSMAAFVTLAWGAFHLIRSRKLVQG